jgi:hypothetical protein
MSLHAPPSPESENFQFLREVIQAGEFLVWKAKGWVG